MKKFKLFIAVLCLIMVSQGVYAQKNNSAFVSSKVGLTIGTEEFSGSGGKTTMSDFGLEVGKFVSPVVGIGLNVNYASTFSDNKYNGFNFGADHYLAVGVNAHFRLFKQDNPKRCRVELMSGVNYSFLNKEGYIVPKVGAELLINLGSSKNFKYVASTEIQYHKSVENSVQLNQDQFRFLIVPVGLRYEF